MLALRSIQHRLTVGCRSHQIDILANTSLYLRGKAGETKRGIVLPYFDLVNIVNNIPQIESHMKIRGNQVDLTPLRKAAPRYTVVRKEIIRLEGEIVKKNARLRKSFDQVLQAEIKQLRQVQTDVKREFYKLDEVCAPLLLQIPNLPLPTRDDKIDDLCRTYIPPKIYSFKPKSHRQLAGDKLQFMNQTLCYLLEDLAGLEQSISGLFVDKLDTTDRIPISGPDFVIDTIVEGACTGNNIIIADQDTGGHKMHLTGGSSLESFCVQFLRKDICADRMKQYTNGRHYREGSEDGGLYSLSQSTRVTAFTGSYNEILDEVEELIHLIIDVYTAIGMPFRLVYVKPEDLSFVEQLRVDLEVWSPYEQIWKQVGHIASHGQFLSNRLTMVAYKEPMYTMFAVLADVQRIVGMLLENNQLENGTYELPDIVKTTWGV